MSAVILSAREAAERLGVSHGVVRRWLLEGRLKGQKAGQGWIIYLSDLERFAAKPRVPGRPRKRSRPVQLLNEPAGTFRRETDPVLA